MDAPRNLDDPQPPTPPPSHSTGPAAAERLPRFLDVTPPAPRRWPKVVIPFVVGASIGVAAYWQRDLWTPHVMALTRAAPLVAPGLNTVDLNGQLQIRWNRNSPAVSQATNGVLHVKGGALSAEEIALDRDHLLSGVFTIARQDERVDVSLVLNNRMASRYAKLPALLVSCLTPKRHRRRASRRLCKMTYENQGRSRRRGSAQPENAEVHRFPRKAVTRSAARPPAESCGS